MDRWLKYGLIAGGAFVVYKYVIKPRMAGAAALPPAAPKPTGTHGMGCVGCMGVSPEFARAEFPDSFSNISGFLDPIVPSKGAAVAPGSAVVNTPSGPAVVPPGHPLHPHSRRHRQGAPGQAVPFGQGGGNMAPMGAGTGDNGMPFGFDEGAADEVNASPVFGDPY